MKLYKLLVHNKNYSVEDLAINPRDFPNLKKGDVVEIYHPEDEFSRLLLQINVFKEDLQGRDTVSVEQSVATTFQLRTYNDVYINTVDPQSVALDSVEITFKDQYMGRSEMWRLKNNLVNTCVYLNKKLELCNGSVRCQVYEMWSAGERVACGVITNNTKVAFRSLTSMVYLFLQMSSEMWDFDIHGDLYFEKAVNGFLDELFQKWKKQSSNHEVTIVLFSRTFYKALSVDEFPQHMRECLQKDYRGRFYEDFYKVAVQNERYDEWGHVLAELRRQFLDYRSSVLEHHGKPNSSTPKAYNSTAAQGNFLEVLNMSLNVFDKHYLERSFDRTGQLSVIVTPGVGVFHVDRELTSVTKQRVVDAGVCSDLVCLGEQPLHAVPLLKFHNKDSTLSCDGYCMPHWLNLSFYSSNKTCGYSSFIPRIKLPPRRTRPARHKLSGPKPRTPEESFSTTVDYNSYDAAVFTLPSTQSNPKTGGGRGMKKTSVSALECGVRVARRKLSDPDVHYWGSSESTSPLAPSPILPHLSPAYESSVRENGVGGRMGSPRRALINPFDPSHISIKLTSNRRRWAHVFPKGPTGLLMQQHHYQASPSYMTKSLEKSLSSKLLEIGNKKQRPSLLPLGSSSGRRGTVLLWGATGEQEWTPSLTTAPRQVIGVDWKSVSVPACLPITTDYFPDEVCLLKDYLFSNYHLLPDDVNADYAQQRVVYRRPLTTIQVFNELISQRLAQSFQIVVDDDRGTTEGSKSGDLSLCHRETKMSIGRLFHRITLDGNEITVTRYRPRHPYPPFSFHYWYRFMAPDHDSYTASKVSFTTEKLENYNWNYLDHYICTRGDSDFPLDQKLKYWRLRVYLLPLSQTVNKRILDGAEHCDIYPTLSSDDSSSLTDSFLRFIEAFVNRLKRLPHHKKPRLELSGFNLPAHPGHRRYSTGIINQSTLLGNSPFRERLGSNRLPEKPRPRSGSKVLDRGKVNPLPDIAVSSELDLDSEHDPGLTVREGASYVEILEAMRHPAHGLSFIAPQPSIPSNSFVSADAIAWLRSHSEPSFSHNQALYILTGMLNEKLICHASGDFSHKFIVGFYIYYIVKASKEDKDWVGPVGDRVGFQSEWTEVETETPTQQNTQYPFLLSHLPPHCPLVNSNGRRKECHLEVDALLKSDRTEWGHLEYQASYCPDSAYEMVVKWVAASGAIIADLVVGWARKAQSCGLQLIPVPADPFALPHSLQSDPLRGPVFVPLDLDPLIGTNNYIFQEFDEESRAQRLSLFQESIAFAFGFITCAVNAEYDLHKQYIHLSGNVFLLVAWVEGGEESSEGGVGGGLGAGRPRRRPLPLEAPTASPHHEYISRHVIAHNAHTTTDNRVGFLWCWNHLVSRRWRTGSNNAACDEPFQNKLLSDFKHFCSNGDNRLKRFWDQAWERTRGDSVPR